MIIQNNEDDGEKKRQQQFTDELMFLIAKYRIIFQMSPVSMIGVLHVLISQLAKSAASWEGEDDEEPPMDFNGKRH